MSGTLWYVQGMRDGHAAGRREMLWLMAVGAAWATEQAQHEERVHGVCTQNGDDAADRAYAYWVARRLALRALADLGDEQARELLR